jgi:hypothetical protein
MAGLDHRIRIVTNAIHKLIQDNEGPLGLNFVGKYDEKRVPKYPSAVISPGTRSKNFLAMNKFDIELSVTIWVYHGDMTVSHATRNEEDLILVDKIEEVLEEDYTLGGLVVFGYVATQEPGIVQPRSSKSEIIAGTRMDWVALSRRLMRA